MSEEDNKAVVRRWIETFNNPYTPQTEVDALAPGYIAPLLAGPVMSKPKNSQRAKRRTKGITHNQTLPPTRPLLGSRGESSHRASRTRDQRRVPCSRPTRIRVRTNCQMSPTVMHSSRP